LKKVFEEIALQAGGSHYPAVGGELLEKFGELVVQKCIESIQNGDYRSSTYTSHDQAFNPKIIQDCIEHIKKTFKE